MLLQEGAHWHGGLGERRTDHLLSARSVLFPTSMMMTSLPLSVRTSSIHFVVCWKEFTSENFTNKKSVVSFSSRWLKKCEANILSDLNIFVSPLWNKHKKQFATALAQSTYLWCRKRQPQQRSLWCNLVWGFGIALAQQCPTTATWSM